MIDTDYIRRKLYPDNEEEHKIQAGDEIPIDVIRLLKQGYGTFRPLCFGPAVKDLPLIAHVECSRCHNEEIVVSISKTKLLDYLRDHYQILCEACKIEVDNEKKILEEKQNQKRQQEVQDDKIKCQLLTDEFIYKYVTNINYVPMSNDELQKVITAFDRNIYRLNTNIIYEAVKKMTYADFLKSPYWRAASYRAKKRAGFKCQLCGATENLATHHTTYKRHGMELDYNVNREDLIVLCQTCHSKFHDKIYAPTTNVDDK